MRSLDPPGCSSSRSVIASRRTTSEVSASSRSIPPRALVTRRNIALAWNGLDETNDYVERLCHALTCWTKGCAAVSILTGAKAVEECKRVREPGALTTSRTARWMKSSPFTTRSGRRAARMSKTNTVVIEIGPLAGPATRATIETRTRHHGHDHNRDRDQPLA